MIGRFASVSDMMSDTIYVVSENVMSSTTTGGTGLSEYTAVIKQDGAWWIGWIEEVPGVNCQEKTQEELIESLRDALRAALAMNRQDARSAAGGAFSEVKIAV